MSAPTKPARPFVRALAGSQGQHWTGLHAAVEGSETLDLAAGNDARSDAEHARADHLLRFALNQPDIREVKNLIRTSFAHRAEAYRWDQLEDDRIYVETRGELELAQGANRTGSELCESALKSWGGGKPDAA